MNLKTAIRPISPSSNFYPTKSPYQTTKAPSVSSSIDNLHFLGTISPLKTY